MNSCAVAIGPSGAKRASESFRRIHLIIVFVSTMVLSSISSHLIHWVLEVPNDSSRSWSYGIKPESDTIAALGSSLLFSALSTKEISAKLSRPVRNCWVVSASPCELEPIAAGCSAASLFLIGISIYDQNEYILSDFRSELVPLRQSVADLWSSHCDWPLAKRIGGQYPLKYTRIIFPTAGRARSVMMAIKARLVSLAQSPRKDVSPSRFDARFEEPVEDCIKQWPKGKLIDRIAFLRNLCEGGRHAFNGPKSLALRRILNASPKNGKIIVVALPVSPEYRDSVSRMHATLDYDNWLAQLMISVPEVHWIRLDRLHALNTSGCFYDLVHMNAQGRRLATDFVTQSLEQINLQ